MSNKIYFFKVKELCGGVYVAARSWKEARKIARKNEMVSEYIEEFIDIEGRLERFYGKPVFIDYEGVLSIEQIIDIGIAWWECSECDSRDIQLVKGNDKNVPEDEYKCNECGHIGYVPYVED